MNRDLLFSLFIYFYFFYFLRLNSYVKVTPYYIQLNSKNALNIIENYDIVIDGTDNVATRYLLNDACVLSGKPLVSGSALKFEGHLSVFNYNNGPCYRCVFPEPPPPETVTNCGDGGVLGAGEALVIIIFHTFHKLDFNFTFSSLFFYY